MSLIGKLAKLDSTLQRGLDNGFAAVFGGRVVPAEVEELLKETAEDELVRTYEGGLEAPNVYTIRVSSTDFAHLSADSPQLPQDFAERMTRFLRNQGWSVAGPVSLVVVEDSSTRTGQLHCHASTSSNPPVSAWDPPLAVGDDEPVSVSPAPAPVPAPPAPAPVSHDEEPNIPAPSYDSTAGANAPTDLFDAQSQTGAPVPDNYRPGPTVTLLLQDGSSRTYLVHEGSNIIGRGSDVDLRLPDTGVSRRHAEVTWDGQDAVLVDLQSTNGTTVNDEPIENWLLADGDVITVGHSFIEVRITG